MRSMGVRSLTHSEPAAPADAATPAGRSADDLLTEAAMLLGPAVAAPPLESRRHPGAPADLEAILSGSWRDTPHGRCFITEYRYALDHQHGAIRLARLLELPGETLGRLGRSAAFEGVDPRRLLFFDTETTGLAGGAGTYVFLAGLGFFEGDTFVVRQLFLPDLHSERALLHLFNDLLGACASLVSFNGRAFDWPLIESRFTLSRMRPAQGEPLHLDLLAPSRRVWKDWLPSCALGALEAHALGLRRRGDVPGWLIPSLYFQYLRGGSVAALQPVFEHNRLDVLSLLTLAGRLGDMLHEPDGFTLEAAECYGLARLYEDLGNYEASVRCYERALKGALSATLRATTLQRLTGAHKKLSQHQEALRIWEELIARETTLIFPYVELAKHYEHHTREYAEAAALVDRALTLCRDPWVRAAAPRNTVPELDRRRARLTKKLARDAAR